MIEVTSIDARPGEAEIVRLMAGYMAARLFTPRQRKALSVIIDLTGQPIRVPVTRDMLGPQKSGLGTRPPKQFEMTVSTSAGIRDAAEVVAHELLHISQAVNGRLLITKGKRKINGIKRIVDTARWMGGKPVIMDELAWQNRPWEIEACHWQSALVSEFLLLTTGQYADQPVQKPKKKQLALYQVTVPAPVMPARSQAPAFTPDEPMPQQAMPKPAMPKPAATERAMTEWAMTERATSTTPVGSETSGPAEAASIIGNNGASIDKVIATAMPKDVPEEEVLAQETLAQEVLAQETLAEETLAAEMMPDLSQSFGAVPDAPGIDLPVTSQIEEPDEALMADLAADLALGGQFGGSFGGPTEDTAAALAADEQANLQAGHQSSELRENGAGNGADLPFADAADAPLPNHDGAVQNMPVYDKLADLDADSGAAVIEVDVPGLDSPRTLDPIAMSRKLVELRDRGLLTA